MEPEVHVEMQQDGKELTRHVGALGFSMRRVNPAAYLSLAPYISECGQAVSPISSARPQPTHLTPEAGNGAATTPGRDSAYHMGFGNATETAGTRQNTPNAPTRHGTPTAPTTENRPKKHPQ